MQRFQMKCCGMEDLCLWTTYSESLQNKCCCETGLAPPPTTLRSLASWVCWKTFKLDQRNWRKKFRVKLPLKIYNTKNLILIGDMNFNSSWCLLQSSSNFNDFCRNGEWGRPRLRRSVWLLSRNKVECGATRGICNYPKVITYLGMS